MAHVNSSKIFTPKYNNLGTENENVNQSVELLCEPIRNENEDSKTFFRLERNVKRVSRRINCTLGIFTVLLCVILVIALAALMTSVRVTAGSTQDDYSEENNPNGFQKQEDKSNNILKGRIQDLGKPSEPQNQNPPKDRNSKVKNEEKNKEEQAPEECKEFVTDSYGGEVFGDVGGGNFDDYYYYSTGGEPTQLFVRSNAEYIYCVGFRYGRSRGRCNGGTQAHEFWRPKPENQTSDPVTLKEFDLEPGEYIHTVELNFGAWIHNDHSESKIVKMMKFYTNERTLGPFGEDDEKNMNITGVQGAEKLSYISGRCGAAIDSINFHFTFDCTNSL